MTCIIDVGGNRQAKRSDWLFKSPLAGAGHIEAVSLQAAQLVYSFYHRQGGYVFANVDFFLSAG